MQKLSDYAISKVILVVIVVIIIVIASAGAFFLAGGNGSTSSTSTPSTSTSIPTTSSSSSSTSTSTSSTSTPSTSTSIPTTSSSSSSTSTSTSSTSTSTPSTSTSIPITTSSSSSTSTSLSTPNQRYNLPYIKSSNTVVIALSILNNATYEVNFNSTNFGAMEIFVPANSNLNLTLYNVQSIPHNLLLVQNNTDVANNVNVGKDGTVLLAIAASTTNYEFVGKSTGSYSGNYPNISAGTYWLTCGTLGHAAAGLWVDLFVSSTVSAPYVVITSPQLRPSGFN